MTKDEVKEWFTAGWNGDPSPDETGGHPCFAWELGGECRCDLNNSHPYAKGTLEEAFQEAYEYHFEDLVLYGE